VASKGRVRNRLSPVSDNSGCAQFCAHHQTLPSATKYWLIALNLIRRCPRHPPPRGRTTRGPKRLWLVFVGLRTYRSSSSPVCLTTAEYMENTAIRYNFPLVCQLDGICGQA
jgi:hypothetical protein